MILKVMSWGLIFLAAVVQSAVTSAEICQYGPTDTSCSGPSSCDDVCEMENKEFDCDHASCKSVGVVAQKAGMTAVGECTTISDGAVTYNIKATCEEDEVHPCASDDVDLCVTVCRSTSGVCGGECLYQGIDIATYGLTVEVQCNALLTFIPTFKSEYSFTEWCECFTVNANDTYDMKMNCGSSACSDGDSSDTNTDSDGGSSNTNTGMIIGIVVGAVVLVIIIVAVVFCMRRRKL